MQIRNALIMTLLTIGHGIIAQNKGETIKQAPIFSVVMAVITILVLFLGIIIQKRWKD